MFSYSPLWKVLVDKKMTKTDLREKAGFSTGTLAQLSKDKYVSMEILDKICDVLEIRVEDVVEHIKRRDIRGSVR